MIDEPFKAESFTDFLWESFFHYTNAGRDKDEKVVIIMDNAA